MKPLKHLQPLLLSLLLLVLVAACGGTKQKESAPAADNLVDLYAGKRIAVVPAMLYDEIARKEFPNSERVYTELATLPVALVTGKCDAILMERSTVPRLQEAHPGIVTWIKDVAQQRLAFGFRKNDKALCNEFNAFLEELKKSGELERLLTGWKTNFDTMPMPTDGDGSGGTLRFGTTCEDAPVSGIRNGEPAGHNIDIVYRFAARKKMKVELMKMNFTGLITAIDAGKCDIIGDNIAITDERAKRVLFSEPFDSEPIDLLTLKGNLPNDVRKPAEHRSQDGLYRTIDDVADKRFSVMVGTIYDAILKEKLPNSKHIYVDSASDLVLSLLAGKCDATMTEHSIAPLIMKEHPEIAVLQGDFYQQELAFGFNKNNPELRDKFSAFIRELKASGELDSINNGWGQNFDGMPDVENTGDGSGGTLRFGTSLSGAPISSIRHGKPAGSNIDMVYRFANKYNMKVDLKSMNFAALIASIESGRCDVIGDNIAVTPERGQRILFSEPYAFDPVDVLVMKNKMPAASDNKMHSADDLNGRRIGLLMGAVYEEYAKVHYPQAKIVYIDNKPDIVLALENNRCDGAFFSSDVIPNILHQHPDLGVLQEKLEVHHIGFAVQKGNSRLRNQLNEFIAQETANGELPRINKEWMDKPYEMPIPTAGGDGSAGVLRVGTTGVDVPSSFVRDGKLAGTDIDIIYRFGTKYNYKIQIEKMPFGGLIAALTSGKIDVIASNLVINEERKKQIDMSDAYGSRDINMLARKADIAAFDTGSSAGENVEASSWWKSLKESFNNNLVKEKRYMLIVDGLWVTLIISLFSALLGTLLGAGICFLRMNRHPLCYGFAKGYITIVRGMPMLVLLMIMYYVIFASVNISAVPVAILAFAINFAAYVSEMFRTAIESIPSGQTEAGIAMGFTKVKTFAYIVLPQAVRRVLPVYKGEFISLVKSTSIVGYIAVEDLTKASDIIRSRTFDAFFPLILVAIIYFFIAWLFTLLLDRMDVSTDPKRKRSKKRKS